MYVRFMLRAWNMQSAIQICKRPGEREGNGINFLPGRRYVFILFSFKGSGSFSFSNFKAKFKQMHSYGTLLSNWLFVQAFTLPFFLRTHMVPSFGNFKTKSDLKHMHRWTFYRKCIRINLLFLRGLHSFFIRNATLDSYSRKKARSSSSLFVLSVLLAT